MSDRIGSSNCRGWNDATADIMLNIVEANNLDVLIVQETWRIFDAEIRSRNGNSYRVRRY